MEDRRKDTETRSRLAVIQAGYEKWARRTLIILALQFVALLGGAYLYLQNKERIHDIQKSRTENMLISCESQNARHDATIKAVFKITQKKWLTAKPQEKLVIRTQRRGTVFIINALAPKQNCAKLVKARIEGKVVAAHFGFILTFLPSERRKHA